jgi:hypothetical protein
MADTFEPRTDRDDDPAPSEPTAPSAPSERTRIRQRLEARRELASHVFVYIVVNAAVVAIWVITGSGYFWPAWLIGLWGIGLVMHAWDAFIRRPITEEDVDRAIDKAERRRLSRRR